MLSGLFGGGAAPVRGRSDDVEASPLLAATTVVRAQDTSDVMASSGRHRSKAHGPADAESGVETVTISAPGGPAAGGSPGKAAATPAAASLAAASAGGASAWALPVTYGLTNLSSVVTIVFANKMVLARMGFSFPVCLTWLHTIFTATGMLCLAGCGMFPVKKVPLARSLPMAAVYVGFIVFNNLSIRYNPVGFYQISKIAITPVVVAIEWLAYGKTVSRQILLSIVVLLAGIGMATVTDAEVTSNGIGMTVAAMNIFVTALYQVWAGTKQKELGLNGMQLLHQVSPSAVVLLGVLIPALEPVGALGGAAQPGTILGFTWTGGAAFWVLFSSVLGLVVTLSTFLFIGVTSSLTYNVVGHLKTVAIVAGGVIIFQEGMTMKKLAGISAAMGGIIWYSQIKMAEARKPAEAKAPLPPAKQ